jgi:carbamoyltransferase
MILFIVSILGLSLSHDASAAITNNDGVAVYAIAEERITRQKNYTGLPVQSIRSLLNLDGDISKVVIGSHGSLTPIDSARLLSPFNQNPSNPIGAWRNPWPGRNTSFPLPNSSGEAKLNIEAFLTERYPELSRANFFWVNHHDSHLGCALGAAWERQNSLLVSLDGFGDGESGALSLLRRGRPLESLSRISALDSLGGLYSAVTERYNFAPNRHEGKITGLAAYGSHSQAVEILASFVNVKNGQIRLAARNDLKNRLLGEIIRKFGFKSMVGQSVSEIVDLAESRTINYADLAFAVQKVIEDSVIELVAHFLKKTEVRFVSLAGGVFSNVRLNQKISEMQQVDNVLVFPNMGDGGISLGGVWHHLYQNGYSRSKLLNSNLYDSMYLAPKELVDISKYSALLGKFEVANYDEIGDLADSVARLIHNGKIVAIHQGQMEFGPRALGNRSILADPRKYEINEILNGRLRRTEFMPFAPIVNVEDFIDCFEIPPEQELTPYYYMTMTCNVRSSRRGDFPAVVHVDGTARPQIVSRKLNAFLHEILCKWKAISNIPVLINTSFNSHEEPIIMELSDSLAALSNGVIDILVYENMIISKSESN